MLFYFWESGLVQAANDFAESHCFHSPASPMGSGCQTIFLAAVNASRMGKTHADIKSYDSNMIQAIVSSSHIEIDEHLLLLTEIQSCFFAAFGWLLV